MPKIIITLRNAVIFGLLEVLACSLLLGDRLEMRDYGGLLLLLVLASFLLLFRITEQQGRLENERLKIFGALIASAASQQEIDDALLGEMARLISARHDLAIVQLDPHDSRVFMRSGHLHHPHIADRLLFERQTDTLVELRDSLFIRLHGGEAPAFFLISKKRRAPRLFSIHNRLRALCALAQTAYQKQFLIDGLVHEMESVLNDQPQASARLARLVFGLTERERSRLALELHDTALQDQLYWRRCLMELLELEDSGINHRQMELVQPLTEVAEGMLDVIDQIREICSDLKPNVSGWHEGNIPISETQGSEIIPYIFGDLIKKARLRADFLLSFETSSFTAQLSSEEWLILYRIVQELLNNAQKHAHATQVSLILESHNPRIHFSYIDDGIGTTLIAEHSATLSKLNRVGLGLNGIRERAKGLNGTVHFDSIPGKGFRFDLHFQPERSVSS